MAHSQDDVARPPQTQAQQPGIEKVMDPQPVCDDPSYQGTGKLAHKVAVISGGDSGIGKAAALLFAKEGADLAIIYLNEHQDAEETAQQITAMGRRCLLIAGDIGDKAFCEQSIDKIIKHYQRIDILVNNAAEQHEQTDLTAISQQQLIRTFTTNVFGMFYLTQATLPHLKAGSAIINSTSVTAYRGSSHLIDYAATKGAIVAFTRSLANALLEQNIRVNAVAPGPIWTPLIPASFDAEHTAKFGQQAPMGRAGQPVEVAPCYLFLASKDSSYMTGQVLHPNGGDAVAS